MTWNTKLKSSNIGSFYEEGNCMAVTVHRSLPADRSNLVWRLAHKLVRIIPCGVYDRSALCV